VVRRDELISPHNKMLSDALTDHLSKKDRRPDKTKDNDRFVTILKGWIDQFALSMTNSDTKNYIQQLLIEPFMEYIFQRAFPYAIIAICIVLSIFIIVIIIFILLLLNRNKCSMCDQLVS
jgi:predicted membrane metal-binding protein